MLNSVALGPAADTPPLLVLHGWNQHLEAMRPLGQKLSRRRQVHLLDLPGFGASPWSGEDWDTRDYARCILDYLDRTGLERVSLLGHSFGGRVSLRIASAWPQRVASLVLLDSAGIPPRRGLAKRARIAWSRGLGQAFALLPKTLAEPLFRWRHRRYASADYQSAGVLKGTLSKVIAEDQTPELGRIQAPTLILWGEQDQETPVEMAHRFKQLIPGSQLVVLPGRDHFPFRGASVHQCAQIVDDFLSEHRT